MSEEAQDQNTDAEMATEIVSAYVAHNSVPMAELPGLLRSVHEALSGLGEPAAAEVSAEPPKPAVPIKKSVTDDYIISLEDGRKFRSLRRYLAGLGMTPADYRAKWGLPSDYPMVAPAYSAKRSELAKSSGLGQQRRRAAPESAPAPDPEAASLEPTGEGLAKKRGGRKKVT